MKTIREIAEHVGVSKSAVYALIKNHGIPTVKRDGLTYVDEKGMTIILAHYTNAQYETVNDSIKDSRIENSIIKVLEKQLDEKQEVIRGLLQALTHEQQLRAVPLIADTSQPSTKKSFWDRLKKSK